MMYRVINENNGPMSAVFFPYSFSSMQGLKYNFQGKGTVQLSRPPVRPPRSFPGAIVSIAGSQIINDRQNVFSTIS